MIDRTTQYPGHLAKLVATAAAQPAWRRSGRGGAYPVVGDAVLCQSEDRRRPADPVHGQLCRSRRPAAAIGRATSGRLLDVTCRSSVRCRSTCARLTKLARAADPAVSSLAVFRDKKNKLFIWGMVDQEPRHSDSITLDAGATARRGPDCFRPRSPASAIFRSIKNDMLIGSLEQNTLVEEYHDVLWSGPVHDLLVGLPAQLPDRNGLENPRAYSARPSWSRNC